MGAPKRVVGHIFWRHSSPPIARVLQDSLCARMAALDASTSATPRVSEWRRLHLAAPLGHLAGVLCAVDLSLIHI